MKITQIAIYVPNQKKASDAMRQIFGRSIHKYNDDMMMRGYFNGKEFPPIDLPLSLVFFHGIIDDVEIEYIKSNDEKHWHYNKIAADPNQPFLSHLGIYCDDEEFYHWNTYLEDSGFKKLQNSMSYNHTNKRAGDGESSSRNYHDIIFYTEKAIGFNIKLTRRVNNAGL